MQQDKMISREENCRHDEIVKGKIRDASAFVLKVQKREMLMQIFFSVYSRWISKP